MAFVDEIIIYIKAGDGGNGVVRWLHEKNRAFGGPSGGDGGQGGTVYAHAVRNVGILTKYRNRKEFAADRGKDGLKKSAHGADGKDLIIDFPVGSVILNKKTGEKISLSQEGEKILLLHGGIGGRGNEFFKTSTNRSPKKFTEGALGQEAEFFIEVELIAHIGLIGLPNAGKTTLLNKMTNARARVGDYPFTTLEPNLGETHGYIIADIPGLIEGAADGKGLGDKFLKHVRRTKILAHLISLENDDPLKAYFVVRSELEKFDIELTKKKEIVILTKTDIIQDQKQLRETIVRIKKMVPIVTAVTMHDNTQIKALHDLLIKELKENV